MTRVKTVYKADEVMHRWAAIGTRDASDVHARNQSGSIAYTGGVLSSYGREIACIVASPADCHLAVFFDIHIERLNAWRDVTKRYYNAAHFAVRHLPAFYVARLPYTGSETSENSGRTHRENLSNYSDRIALAEKKVKYARASKEWRASELVSLQEEVNRYCRFFGLAERYDASVLQALRDTYARERAEREAREEARQREHDAQMRRTLAERVAQWRAGLDVPVYDYPDVLLRKCPDMAFGGTYGELTAQIETSKGATVPLADAERLYRAIVRKDAQRDDRIGSYAVRNIADDAIDIGCHHITRAEIEVLATALGWNGAAVVAE